MYLTKNINSHFNPSHIYGLAGDEVEIVSDYDNVKVVRHLGKKVGFPVQSDNLSIQKVKSEIPTIVQPIIYNKASTKKQKDVEYKPTLF